MPKMTHAAGCWNHVTESREVLPAVAVIVGGAVVGAFDGGRPAVVEGAVGFASSGPA